MKIGRLFAVAVVMMVVLCSPSRAAAHPFFNTTMQLEIQDRQVTAAVEIPITELGLALHKDFKISQDPDVLLSTNKSLFRGYITEHTKPHAINGKPWKVEVDNFHITTATVPQALGRLKKGTMYQKLAFDMKLTPAAGDTTRKFVLGYTAVTDDVPAHSSIVSIANDWASGIHHEQPAQVGIITYDMDKKMSTPLVVDVSRGSLLSGYIGMVKLGMGHIRSGTDHLLFLLTLLLPAPLLLAGRRWGGFAGTRRTLRNIIKITTAFTIGHSITLIIATLGRVHVSSQPIEALIAISIIVSAVHALRPIFPGKEMWVAAGFGLIHGTAFSFVLAELHLNSTQTAISLFGFNVGIELMQLLIIALVIPPLIVFARTRYYSVIRIGGASLALIASIGWLFTRIGFANPIGTLADSLSAYAHWLVIALAAGAAVVLLRAYHESHPIDSQLTDGGIRTDANDE